MKYNFSGILKEIDGTNALDGKKKIITMRDQCILALTFFDPNERVDGLEKFKRASLAEKIQRAGIEDVELDVDEVAMLKKVTGDVLTPVAILQIWPLLDQKESARKD